MPLDVLTAALIALGAAGTGLVAIYAFRPLHRLFHNIGHPWLMVTTGGVVLGLLGALGGRITLFRGVDQMRELTSDASDYTIAGFALVIVVKLAALVVSATCGFPGGRIFPAVFLGVAIGLLVNDAFPAVPASLCVSAGVLGTVLAVSRDGWVSLFLAVVVVGEVSLTPILLLATLPAWLLLTGKPQMVLGSEPEPDASTRTEG